ncbi:hypothetical protein ACNKHQ_00335 [Shigella flexneri]
MIFLQFIKDKAERICLLHLVNAGSAIRSKLGLGTVIAMDARTVTLLFPGNRRESSIRRHRLPVTRVMPSERHGEAGSCSLTKL